MGKVGSKEGVLLSIKEKLTSYIKNSIKVNEEKHRAMPEQRE